MNIKQAEQASGVSRRNIRFYEQEGLITPERNRNNDYREYSEEDIAVLKRIRMLRMVDMPLDQIRAVLLGEIGLKGAAQAQKEILKAKARELETAIRFCDEFASVSGIEALDADGVLQRMEFPENRNDLFAQWVDDYKRLAKAQEKKTYTFYPEETVEKPEDVTLALFRYADANGLDMVITKEGMRPELTINGYEYTAEVIHTFWRSLPVTAIQCRAVHPEEFEPADIPGRRKRVLRFLRGAIPFALVLLMLLPLLFALQLRWWEWLLFAMAILAVLGVRIWLGIPVERFRRQAHLEMKKENGKTVVRFKKYGEE